MEERETIESCVQKILESPYHEDTRNVSKTFFADQLNKPDLPEDQITYLLSLQPLEKIRYIYRMALINVIGGRLTSDFNERYGTAYTESGLGLVAKDIENFVYRRVPLDELTPTQKEFAALTVKAINELFQREK